MRSGSKRLAGLAGALVGVIVVAGFAPFSGAADCGVEKPNLKAAAARTGMLSQMAAATKLAGLDTADSGVGPLTLFAPSDAAFEALPPTLRTKLLAPENRGQLAILLMHHAVPGEFSTSRLLKARARHYAVDAVDGTLIEITTGRGVGNGNGIDVGGAKIVQADIAASNGIIHIIDKVLIPPAMLAELDRQPSATHIAADVLGVE